MCVFFVLHISVFSRPVFVGCYGGLFCQDFSLHPRSQMVLVDAFDGELICEYGVQEQGEECRLDVSKEIFESSNKNSSNSNC